MRIIYVDTLFLRNAVIDYLLLLSAGRLCTLPLRRGRMALGAVWGGAYAVLAAAEPALFALWTVKLAAGALAVVIAYGVGKRSLRALAAFYAVAAAFGGAVHAGATLRGEPVGAGLSVSLPVLCLSFALCYAAVTLVFRRAGRRAERRLLRVSVSLGGRTAEFSALSDSGNELTDPISGCPVLVASPQALAPLFDHPEWLTLDAPAALERLCRAAPAGRFRLLPCTCVAAEHTLLLCFRPDCLRIEGKKRRELLVGVSRAQLAPDGEYEAIVAE